MTRTFLIATTSAAALFASSALAQQRSQGPTPAPDFSGIWGNPYLYGIEPPLSGPGPVVNTSRRRQGVDIDGRPLPPAMSPLLSDARRLVGDYQPILKPTPRPHVKRASSLTGVGFQSAQPVLAQGCRSFSRILRRNCCSNRTSTILRRDHEVRHCA